MPLLKRTVPLHYKQNEPRHCLSLLALLLTALLVAPSAFSTQTSDPELLRILRDTVSQADSFDDRYDAEVWLLIKSNSLARFLPDKSRRFEFLRKVHRAATRAGLEPEIVLALIEVESHFDPYAVSSAGAQGLMQVMPFWKKEIGRPNDNLTDTDTNLRYGCTILKHYLKREKGRLADALARYNGSYGQYWYSERVLVAWEKRWR